MAKIYKCSPKKRVFCVNMDKFATDQYGSGRRIFIGQSMNFNTGQTGVRAWYQFGSKQKDFVMMLFCPWCGGRLGWQKPKERGR